MKNTAARKRSTHIADLDMNVRLYKLLKFKKEIKTLGGLCDLPFSEIVKTPGMGDVSIREAYNLIKDSGYQPNKEFSDYITELNVKDHERLKRALKTPIADIGLSPRTYRFLKSLDVFTLGGVTSFTAKEILDRHNCSGIVYKEIRKILVKNKLRFDMGELLHY